MEILIAFPLLSLLVLLQSSIVSRVFLLQGSADLVLLVILAWALQERVNTAWHWAVIGGLLVNLVSALPLFTPLIGYLLAVAVAVLLKKRVWQVPFFAMSLATFFGTLLSMAVSWLALVLRGHPLPLQESITLIILPSLLLNMLLAFLVFTMVGGLVEQLYPEEITT